MLTIYSISTLFVLVAVLVTQSCPTLYDPMDPIAPLSMGFSSQY